jgi:uncharacterized membrane protein YGL010W
MAKLGKQPSGNRDEPDQTVGVSGGELDVREEAGFYPAYADFSRNVRTWFIAYGIGAPVLLLTTDSAIARLSASGQAKFISILFLTGVAVQILTALLYKSAMWYLYIGELRPDFRTSRRHKCADWISESHILELALDLITIGCFGIATFNAMNILL